MDVMLDQEALQQLRDLTTGDGKDALLNRLIDVYNRESPKLMEQLVHAHRIGNLRDIESAAHTLKSSSAQLGATEFSEVCREIEYIAKKPEEDVSELSSLIGFAEGQLVAVMKSLEAEKV